MNAQELTNELHSAADILKPLMPSEDILWFRELIENNEIGIGLEVLLDQIYEHDVVIPRKSYEILKKIAKGIVDDDYFAGIKYNDD